MITSGQAAPAARLWRPAGYWVLVVVTAPGCYSQPGVIESVKIDIPSVCATLIMEHDGDRNGMLSEEELAGVPPLNTCTKRMDKDGDRVISEAELQAHFEKVFNPQTGMIGAMCRVTNKGRPLAGALVHYIPAEYLQLDRQVMPIASGITSSQGVAQMEIHPDYIPEGMPKLRGLVRPGFYLVEITREDMHIPAHYNIKTTLGVEVSAETNVAGPIHIPLKF
jgi:hypothetical protein